MMCSDVTLVYYNIMAPQSEVSCNHCDHRDGSNETGLQDVDIHDGMHLLVLL